MSPGAWMMLLASLLTLSTLAFLIYTTIRSVITQRSPGRSIWKDFGLGLGLMIMFLATWLAHGISEWQAFTDEQRDHDQPVEVGDFFSHFAQATLENWQSEFLQLFSFVTLAALYVHRGSAESKDTEERIEASLRRVEEKLGTLPSPAGRVRDWELPDPPMAD
jgi:hypothetical protein